MFIQKYFSKWVFALGLITLSGLAQAQFVAGMNKQQLIVETTSQLNMGIGIAVVARQAIDAGLNPALVTEALIKAGQDGVVVVKVMIAIDSAAAESITAAAVTASLGQVGAITSAAIAAAPQLSKSIVLAVLIVPGVNPADVVSASASGKSSAINNNARKVNIETPHSGGRGAVSPS